MEEEGREGAGERRRAREEGGVGGGASGAEGRSLARWRVVVEVAGDLEVERVEDGVVGAVEEGSDLI